MAYRKYTILLNLQEERYIEKKRCFCEHQRCHGWFIPSRIDQNSCLFDLEERGVAHLYIKIIQNNGKTKNIFQEGAEEKEEI